MKRNIYLYFIFVVLSSFSVMGTFLSLYFSKSGLSLSVIAIVFMVYQITKFIFEVPTGKVADKWGNKRSGIVGAVCILVGNTVILFAECTVINMIIYMIIQGFGYTFISGAVEALYVNTIDDKDKLVKYNAIERLVFYCAIAFSSISGGFIIKAIGFRGGFIIDVIVACLLVLVISLMKNSVSIERSDNNELSKENINKTLLSLYLIDFATAFSFIAVEDYYSYYLNETFEINASLIGIISAVQLIFGALAGVIVHKIINHELSVKYIYIGALAKMIIMIPLYLITSQVIWVPVLYTLSTVVFSVYAPIKYEVFQKNIKDSSRAFYLSVQSIMISMGGIAFSIFNSVLGMYYSYSTIMIMALLITGCMICASWGIMRLSNGEKNEFEMVNDRI